MAVVCLRKEGGLVCLGEGMDDSVLQQVSLKYRGSRQKKRQLVVPKDLCPVGDTPPTVWTLCLRQIKTCLNNSDVERK